MASSRISRRGPSGKGRREGQLHLHALGEGLDQLFAGEAEFLQVMLVQGSIPAGVEAGENVPHLGGGEAVVEGGLVQHHPHLGLDRPLVRQVVQAQHLDLPGRPRRIRLRMHLMVVDLPAPFSPIRPMMVPPGTVKDTSSSLKEP